MACCLALGVVLVSLLRVLVWLKSKILGGGIDPLLWRLHEGEKAGG